MKAAYTFRGFTIRGHMLESLNAYVEHGQAVDSFLAAVLENSLSAALGRADDENLANLPAYGAYLYNEVPGSCHGSPAKVEAWIAKGGTTGLRAPPGYTAEELERDNPYNQWMRES